MLLGCRASHGEESLKTALVGLQSTGRSSISSYCFPLAKLSSRLGISLQTFLSFLREAGFVNLMPTINLRVFLLHVINWIFVLALNLLSHPSPE